MSDSTEKAAERFRGLDTWNTTEILSALWDGQMRAISAVLPALEKMAPAVDEAAVRLGSSSGRLIYVGAGSSGVISLLDSLELGSTFDWSDERAVVILPSGLDLSNGMADSVEDEGDVGAARIDDLDVTADDVVVGVSASGRSAFTVQALKRAGERGALTIGFANNTGSPLEAVAHHMIVALTGAEVVAGSTRLGAGTSQKVLFNLFSTTLMTRLGGIHDNLMVNVRPSNAKLRKRCAAMVAQIANTSEEEAADAIARFGSVKRAVLGLAGVAEDAIEARLQAAGGVLRRSLEAEDKNQ
ncbi:N-acetylmuramic acid 6-phosphate etherase [Pseudovibrio exalbescens]|uniref:N-acetylmuramic acid 6-phosphate etherase n=1 Tax=Pseudovibrio exalbescens TaxID=197461 RepID=UPI002366E604|nr:N-acetylmuramic acid 6-phosphate etherase [Pseudovibrio exalbescens]MDD7911751.1 N-acetylmuramic acid 6-phosphate etherase [Pseudovibrio exalbescens]